MEDPYGLRQIDIIGADKVMWSSDYPHPESTVGYSRQAVMDIFEATNEETGRKIVGGNALKVWDLS
jgi:predicted TIM-barrel fold metal-dependent hydrolase